MKTIRLFVVDDHALRRQRPTAACRHQQRGDHDRSREPRPLAFGRVSRVLFGVGVILTALLTDLLQISILGFVALIGLGLSFLLGGMLAIPGCELAALPNLLLPKRYRFTFP